MNPPVCGGPPENLTEEEKVEVDKYNKDLHEWTTNQAIVWQQIVSMVPDLVFLKSRGKKTVKEAWDLLKCDYEKRSRMFMVDLKRRIQDQKCAEGGDIRTHFYSIRNMVEELAMLRDELSEDDHVAILLGSLPRSYSAYLSTISATLSIMNKKLTPEALMLSVINEFDCQLVSIHQAKKELKDATFFAGNGRNVFRKFRKGQGGSKRVVECFNCHKKGHMK